MIRRLMLVVNIFALILIAVLIVLAYLTCPIWIVVWIIGGWWVYPWGNAVIHNINLWFRIKSDQTNILGEFYTMDDYHRLKWSLDKQDWDDD